MNKLSQWIYAYNVCKKYNIKWNPFRDLSNASYEVRWDDSGITKRTIHMSPFYPNFKETFLHEVGHITLYKRGRLSKIYNEAEFQRKYFEAESIWLGGKLLLPTLKEESLASRFARKAMRGKADVDYLLKAFKTYTAFGYEQIMKCTPEDARTITRLTDTVAKCIRRIEK